MGAWAEGSFDNDDAGDWVWELEEANDVAALEDAFYVITDGEEYLESSACAIAIAAAEVVAALRKRPLTELPEEVVEFVARVKTAPSPALLEAAVTAVERVAANSELQELWDESSAGEKWHQSVKDLITRLK